MTPPKRFLLMKSENTVNILWLDEAGSCQHITYDGHMYPARHHVKLDEKGQRWVTLCPNGLSTEEWRRVFVDDPPGAWLEHFNNYRMEPPKKRQYGEMSEAV